MEGRGVQVVNVEDNHTYQLNDADLRAILMRDDVKDLPVAVVSVAGAFRGGKSFLLNFFLRYLTAPRAKQLDGSWIGDDQTPLSGFSWRGGSKRNTTGIVIWSEPIITTLGSGQKGALILMDTQGTFDSSSTVRDCSTIFALSTLLSSIQVYNISQNIGEDNLQHLQLFTEYGKLIKDESGKAFQVLEFLVRDWQNPSEFNYGSAGGNAYLTEKLQIKDTQAKELRDLREHIRDSFTSVACFLLPHPGLQVIETDFDGKNIDISVKFKMYVKELTKHFFGPEMLNPKEINGQIVKAGQLYTYFTSYMKIFNSDEIPTPTNIMKATAEAGLMAAFEEARCLYETGMEKGCGSAMPSVPADDLKDLHVRHVSNAVACFKSKKIMGSKHDVKKQLKKLNDEIEKRLPQFVDLNIAKVQKAMTAAKEAYDSKIGQIRAEQLLCVHPLDLENVHREALRAAIDLFDRTRKCLSKKEDKERAHFIKGFEKQYELLFLTNEQNNKMAVTELRLEYWQTMESQCSGETPLSESEFLAAHKQALEAAMQGFDNKRNHPNSHDEDSFKANLMEVILNYFKQMKAINKSKNKSALQAGVRAYDAYMKSAWDPSEKCLHPADLDDEHAVGERRAIAAFRPNRVSTGKVYFDTTDKDEKTLANILSERFNELKEDNDSANETAVQAAYNEYITQMDYNCGFSYWWILLVPLIVNASRRTKYHEESRDKALRVFYSRRRDNDNSSEDHFKEKLVARIKEAFKKYK